MASSVLTALVASLGSSLPTAMSSFFNGHAQATTDISGLLTELVSVIDNPAQVQAIALQVGGVSGAPLEVRVDAMNLAKFSTNPAMIMQIVAKMQVFLNNQSNLSLTHLLSSTTTTA